MSFIRQRIIELTARATSEGIDERLDLRFEKLSQDAKRRTVRKVRLV